MVILCFYLPFSLDFTHIYILIFIICQCDINYLIGWFGPAWRKLVKNVLMPQMLIIGVLFTPFHCSSVYSFHYVSEE